jgi:hypothetical protein
MALPLIPFAAGLAVGALAAYGYKDGDIRSSAERGARWLYDTLAGAYESVAGAVGGVFGSTVVSAEGPAAAQLHAEPAAADAMPEESPAEEQPSTPPV